MTFEDYVDQEQDLTGINPKDVAVVILYMQDSTASYISEAQIEGINLLVGALAMEGVRVYHLTQDDSPELFNAEYIPESQLVTLMGNPQLETADPFQRLYHQLTRNGTQATLVCGYAPNQEVSELARNVPGPVLVEDLLSARHQPGAIMDAQLPGVQIKRYNPILQELLGESPY